MENIQKAMFRIGNNLVNELVNQLEINDSVDTGSLKNSIRMELSSDKITIIMNGYGKDVEYGVPIGTYVDPEQLRGWCRRKLGDESAAEAVSLKIMREGIQPRPFIRPILNTKLKGIIQKAFS